MLPKKILVATDFSPAADRAVQRAASLASRSKAALRLVHAVPPLGLIEGLFSSRQQWSDAVSVRAGEALKERAARIADSKIRVSTGLLVGRASVAIAEAIKEYEPDLVVVGARGEAQTQGAEPGLGGTASKLLRRARVPLLLVRRSEADAPRRVLAAVDLTPASDNVARWARVLPAKELTLVHVFEAPFADRMRAYGVSSKAIDVYAVDLYDEKRQAMQALLRRLDAGDDVKTLVLRGSAVKAISRRLRTLSIDTLVLGQHGRRKRDAAVPYGSVCHYLSYFTSVDVLVVP